MKIGDKVKIKLRIEVVPNKEHCIKDFKSSGLLGLVTGGTTVVGEHYFKNFAKIIDKQGDYWIVQHRDINDNLLRLGYLTGWLEPLIQTKEGYNKMYQDKVAK